MDGAVDGSVDKIGEATAVDVVEWLGEGGVVSGEVGSVG